jgi:hypothetical protein
MLGKIKRERRKKEITGLEKGEMKISPFNRLRPVFLHDPQTEIGSGRSLNRWLASLQAQTPLKEGIENFILNG